VCDAAIIDEFGWPEPVRNAEELDTRAHCLCERAICRRQPGAVK
jgi:hypothetical protein